MNAEEMVAEINRRAQLFCVDNPKFANHLPAITAAMLIGASIAVEDLDVCGINELTTPLPLSEG